MTLHLADTDDLSTLASSLLSPTPPASLIKPLRRSDSLLSLDHEEWMERAAVLTDQLDQLLADFSSTSATRSIAAALHHAFLLLSPPSSASSGAATGKAAGLTLDTLESAVIWRLPATRQAQVWLTAYVLSAFPSLIATSRPRTTKVRKLPQDAADPSALYDRLAHGMQVAVDSMSLEGMCGSYQAAGPVVRFKSAQGTYLGAHQGVYWADQTRLAGGHYAFMHTAADAREWRWDMKGLGWRMRPVVVDGQVVFEVECAGEGVPGCERGWVLAVVDDGVGRWVGVTAKAGDEAETDAVAKYWCILPSPTNADLVVLQVYPRRAHGHNQESEPMYLSVVNQARRDMHSLYLELSPDSPISFEVQVLDD